MSVKLIFGENGQGKTLYANTKLKDNDEYIKLSSDISGWYNEKTHKLSQFLFRSRHCNEKIKELEMKLLSSKSSLSKISGFKITKFKKMLSQIEFGTLDEWEKYKHSGSQENIDIHDLIDFYSFLNEHSKTIESFSNEKKEAIILFKSITFEKNVFSIDEIKDIQKEILKNIKDIKKFFTKEEILIFDKIKLKDIKRILSNKKAEIQEETLIKIKDKIIESEEYLEIVKIKNDKEKIRKESIKFEVSGDEENVSLEDEGRTLVIDLSEKKYSKGQKTSKVFEVILNSLGDDKKHIILDDLFETLDTTTQEKIFSSIIDSNHDFEILTHEELTVFVIQSIADINKFNLEEYKIKCVNNKPKIYGCELTLNFRKLNSKLWDSDVKENHSIQIFAKVFGRYISKAGSLTGGTGGGYKNNTNSQTYKFSSNNIFHYNNDIDYVKLNELYSMNISENLNTIDFLEILKNMFNVERKRFKFGISFDKIQDFIDLVISCVSEEKRFFDSLSLSEKQIFSKEMNIKSFYNKFWNQEEKIKPSITKTKRNQIQHKLDNTLISITK